MLGITKKNSVGDALTPKIILSYSDFIRIDTENEETAGYFMFQAKSILNQEIHHIRAFNLNSNTAQQHINQTITIFLQETLRLCSMCPDAVLLDTFEFSNNKICYAVKPITSPINSSLQTLDIFRLLKGLISDLKCLSHYGDIQIPVSTIYQIEASSSRKNVGDNSLPQYFVQDWNQVISSTALALTNLSNGQFNPLETSLQMSETRQKSTVYQHTRNRRAKKARYSLSSSKC